MFTEIKQYYRTARLAWRFVTRDEMKSSLQIPFRKRVAMLRKGYLSQAAEIYNLTDYKLDDYFSDWAKARMSMMYDMRNPRGGYQYGLNNKIFSTAILGQHFRVPELYAVIEHGCIIPLHPNASEIFACSWIDACRASGGKLVFKPSAGGRGAGVFIISEHNGELRLDGVPVSNEAIQNKIKSLDEYIVVEFLKQGEYANSLYPETTNTIRVVTLIDPETNTPYLPIAVQRIGRNISRPVDNWNRSGLCAEIDFQTGKLSRAAAWEKPQNQLLWYDVHPDTGSPIRDVQVPGWEKIKQKILNAASRMAYFKYLSWDVVTMDDGMALIEADTVAGIQTLQVHRPLLADKRIKEFLQYHGYVR